MNYHWAMLDIAPTNDIKVIKRAYATQLKSHRPEDNAERFQRLREAYEWACQIGIAQAEHWQDDADDDADYDDVVEDDAGFVANRILFRTIWTPSPSGTNAKAFWFSIGITLAITGLSEAFNWPNYSVLLAAFLLFAVAQDASTTFASAVLGSLFAFVTAVIIWPTQAPEKFLITAPITLSLVIMSLYFYQRRLPAEKLLARLLKAPAQPRPVTAFNSNGFSWWWLIAGILLLRLLAVGR